MTPDLQAAAERCAGIFASNKHDYANLSDEAIADLILLADHAAREWDGRPVDEAFLISVGADEHQTGLRYEKCFTIPGGAILHGYACEGPQCWLWTLQINSEEYENPTRGQVQQLVGLGIQLSGGGE